MLSTFYMEDLTLWASAGRSQPAGPRLPRPCKMSKCQAHSARDQGTGHSRGQGPKDKMQASVRRPTPTAHP